MARRHLPARVDSRPGINWASHHPCLIPDREFSDRVPLGRPFIQGFSFQNAEAQTDNVVLEEYKGNGLPHHKDELLYIPKLATVSASAAKDVGDKAKDGIKETDKKVEKTDKSTPKAVGSASTSKRPATLSAKRKSLASPLSPRKAVTPSASARKPSVAPPQKSRSTLGASKPTATVQKEEPVNGLVSPRIVEHITKAFRTIHINFNPLIHGTRLGVRLIPGRFYIISKLSVMNFPLTAMERMLRSDKKTLGLHGCFLPHAAESEVTEPLLTTLGFRESSKKSYWIFEVIIQGPPKVSVLVQVNEAELSTSSWKPEVRWQEVTWLDEKIVCKSSTDLVMHVTSSAAEEAQEEGDVASYLTQHLRKHVSIKDGVPTVSKAWQLRIPLVTQAHVTEYTCTCGSKTAKPKYPGLVVRMCQEKAYSRPGQDGMYEANTASSRLELLPKLPAGLPWDSEALQGEWTSSLQNLLHLGSQMSCTWPA